MIPGWYAHTISVRCWRIFNLIFISARCFGVRIQTTVSDLDGRNRSQKLRSNSSPGELQNESFANPLNIDNMTHTQDGASHNRQVSIIQYAQTEIRYGTVRPCSSAFHLKAGRSYAYMPILNIHMNNVHSYESLILLQVAKQSLVLFQCCSTCTRALVVIQPMGLLIVRKAMHIDIVVSLAMHTFYCR